VTRTTRKPNPKRRAPTPPAAPTLADRYAGALLGLAAGDALGATLEFATPPFRPVRDLVGGGPWQLAPGQWTDDTSCALCLAVSLVERKGFDPADILGRLDRWMRPGDDLGTAPPYPSRASGGGPRRGPGSVRQSSVTSSRGVRPARGRPEGIRW
jgi:hypothetical protein